MCHQNNCKDVCLTKNKGSSVVHTFFNRANHCVVMLARSVVARLHLHAVLGPEHLRVLAVS